MCGETVYLQHFSELTLEGGRRKAVPFFIGMAKLTETLKQLVEAEAATHSAFVVGHSSGEKGLYRYYVDSASALTMNVLTEITRNVSKKIDELELGEDAFTFEVSSPGADSPLTDQRQFEKHVGRQFEIVTESEKFDAVLTSVNLPQLEFEETKTEKVNGKKQTLVIHHNLTFENIQKATIKISFK